MILNLLLAASMGCFTLQLDDGGFSRLDGFHLPQGRAGSRVRIPRGILAHFRRMAELPGGPKVPLDKLPGMKWVEFETLQDPMGFVEDGSTFPTPDLACGECYAGGQPYPETYPGVCWPNSAGAGCSVCRVCTEETTKKWGGVVYKGIWEKRKIKPGVEHT